MSDGTVFLSSQVFSALLLMSLIVMAGCEVPVASSLPRATAAASPLDVSDSGRHRSDFAGNRWTLNRDGVYLYQTNNGKLLEVSLEGSVG